MAQSWLASDPELTPSEIGILVPNPDLYGPFLREALALAGLPLSGLAPARDMRDVAGETVLLFLLCRRPLPPAMALASLYISPLMPWPNETGQQLATAVMGGDFEPRLAHSFVGQAKSMYAAVRRSGATMPRALADELSAFVDMLTSDAPWAEAVVEARHRIERLRGQLLSLRADAEIPWDDLIRSAGPNPPAATATFARTTAAITVLSAGELPWRPVRRMIVLGFSDGAYPSPPAGNPFFIDSEIAEIEEACGLKLVAQRDVLEQRLQLFERQIAAASDGLTIFTPFRDLSGKRIAPSGSLALIARCVEGVEDPAKLIVDLAQVDAAQWPADIPRVAMTLHVPAPQQPGRTLTLGRDLLSIRRGEDGTTKPQSPSRLEKLIVSPLAWLLEELDAGRTADKASGNKVEFHLPARTGQIRNCPDVAAMNPAGLSAAQRARPHSGSRTRRNHDRFLALGNALNDQSAGIKDDKCKLLAMLLIPLENSAKPASKIIKCESEPTLDADPPPQGVKIARLFTGMVLPSDPNLVKGGSSWLLNPHVNSSDRKRLANGCGPGCPAFVGGSIGNGGSKLSDGNRRMSSKKTLNARNLEAPGAGRLAELLIEISSGNAAVKRRLRLELAGALSPGSSRASYASACRRSRAPDPSSTGRAGGPWSRNLETRRRAIVDQVGRADPAEALDLVWRFMELANSMFGRCDDSSGTVIGIFHAACSDLGEIASAVKPDAKGLAERAGPPSPWRSSARPSCWPRGN